MNLQRTIEELEKQAAQYAEAANTLRALLSQETVGRAATAQPATRQTAGKRRASTKTAAKSGARSAAKAGGRIGKRPPVSAETRAKISEKLRAAHAARKAKS